MIDVDPSTPMATKVAGLVAVFQKLWKGGTIYAGQVAWGNPITQSRLRQRRILASRASMPDVDVR
ncbi:MAG: hypothetical protein Q8L45_15860 [Xanthomonadaceae bacterium]|jgi:hypothetical protein|nr:hypothetical protein [Xanthomonadaceae bacterium]MDP2183905.1 hypothetical protein [Xanthomonadales bacterium]MDZ4117125.1 hypothetical protein [Xanthomonadaceae bacterium]MDZ4376973.1 hypothetical protein [Xanthomonadaceae bacterium]PKM14330.1 MAG: hypothetical protein CVV12_14520 [Gammaproteobacteria bacterium HGW-Gammaproteobacteria-2]